MEIKELAVVKKSQDAVERIPKQEFERRIMEIAKCKRDIVYFAETYFRVINLDKGLHIIKLYDVQKEFLQFLVDNNRVICCSGRQQGKSTIYCIYALWLTTFYPDKKVMILANKAATALELLEKINMAWQYLPAWLKCSATVINKGELSFGNKSSIRGFASSSDAARGFSANVVICDEFAFLQRSLADKLFTSMFPVISSSKNGKFIIVSTPNGVDNLYYDIWQKAHNTDEGQNLDGWKAFTMWWWQVPGHDEAWKRREIEAIGAERFAQEFNNEFLAGATSKKLIPDDVVEKYRKKLAEMKKTGRLEPKKQIVTSEDGQRAYEFRMWKGFDKSRTYVASADIAEGVGADSSVLYIWDITDMSRIEMCAAYSSNKTSLVEFAYVASKMLDLYGNPYLFAERNGVSGGMLDSLRITYGYQNIASENKKNEPGIYSHVSVKSQACLHAKDMLTTEGFGFTIYDKDLIDEFGMFVKKDGKSSVAVFHVPRPAHDDHIMAFIWACYALQTELIEKYFVVCQTFMSQFGNILPRHVAPLIPYDQETLKSISKNKLYLDFLEFKEETMRHLNQARTAERAANKADIFTYGQPAQDMFFNDEWDGGSWNSPNVNAQRQQLSMRNHMPAFFV